MAPFQMNFEGNIWCLSSFAADVVRVITLIILLEQETFFMNQVLILD
jgi:hypothetical protein